jgi:uncharacterized protein
MSANIEQQPELPRKGTVQCWRCFLNSPADALACQYCEAAFEQNAPVSTPTMNCWRCTKEVVAGTMRCPFCDARLVEEEHHAEHRQRKKAGTNGLLAIVLHYSLGLLILLVAGWSISFGIHVAGENDEARFRRVLPILVTCDLLFLGLAVIAFFHLRPLAKQPVGNKQSIAWILAFPLLALLLAINFGYHWVLDQIFHLDSMQYPFWNSDLWPWTVLLVCVQPAVAEEIFFRHVVLGVFRRHMSFHGAVWVSALIFALAHLGAIISIPTLLLAGVLLAYLRAATGSLILPMIVHFLHNLIVVMFF